MKKLPEKIIDFHVHLFPDKLFEAIWKKFKIDYRWDVAHQLYYAECVDFLRNAGIDKIVYSNYAHKKGVARGLNEWNLKILDEIPSLYCFAAFHPDDDDLNFAEKMLEHPRVLGFKLQLLVQRFYPHDERLWPLYEMVIKRGKRILFHTGTGPVGNEFVGIKHFGEVLKRYPDIPANIAHMGALEYMEFIELCDDFPGIILDTSFTFFPGIPGAFNLGPDYLERYKDRIVYGSDFPNLIFPREVEIDHLLSLDLSQEFYDKVFRDNGERIINISAG